MKNRNMRIARVAAVSLALVSTSPALAEPDRTVLPVPEKPFAGTIGPTIDGSVPDLRPRVTAPEGAPNILLFMADDVGFAMSSAFGGPVPTPNMDRLAASGQRYNRFHTTGICSPSRAALLTGRNHHNAETGHIADLSSGFPGHTARIPRSTATIAEVLKLNGYNTAMFGKHHNIPPGEHSPAGPFDSWPTGLGFEYFLGFTHGESDQWRPVLHRGITMVDDEARPAELVDKRLADDLIAWVRDQKAAARDKPFLAYLAPGSVHSPIQAPPEHIARFKGRFDMGWDKLREETWKRQLILGIIPKGTKLTPRPDGIAAWTALTPAQKAFAARGMEVAAAQMAYQDEQLGRILDEIERMGIAGDTLIVVIQGDNGGSGDGGLAGSVSDFATINGLTDASADEAWMQASLDALGSEDGQGNYAQGWGWAMNAPLPWYKHRASMLGALRNGMIFSWQGHVANPGAICEQFSHLIDIVPTLLEAVGVPAPRMVNGAEQKPMDGQSLVPSLSQCRPDTPRTQYFEVGGKGGLYHDGWFLSSDLVAGKDAQPWALYDLAADYSQSTDLAARNPAKASELDALWRREAERNHVFPVMADWMTGYRAPPPGPRPGPYEFWGNNSGINAHPGGLLQGHAFRGSWTIEAALDLPREGASGVIAALGSRFAGWSLLLDEGRPVFHYARSRRPGDVTRIAGSDPLPVGSSSLTVRFRREGEGPVGPADVEILIGSHSIATGRVPVTFFMPLAPGERLDIGRDTGVAVTAASKLEGEVRHLKLTLE